MRSPERLAPSSPQHRVPRPATDSALHFTMIVCVCHQVSDRTIAQRSREGVSFDELQFELRVATQCGRCEDCARQVHAEAACAGGRAASAVLYLHKSGATGHLTPQGAI